MKITQLRSLLFIGVATTSLLAEESRFFIDSDILNIRSKPSINAPIVGYCDRTKSYTSISKDGDWVKTTKGYVNQKFIRFYKKIKDLKLDGVVMATSLNVRVNPGATSDVVYGYIKGETVFAKALYKNEDGTNWIETDEGFVSAQYILVDEVKEKIPQKKIEKPIEVPIVKEEQKKQKSKDVKPLVKELKVEKHKVIKLKKSFQKTKKERISSLSYESTKLKAGVTFSDIEGSGDIDIKELETTGLSVGLESCFSLSKLNDIHPLVGIEYDMYDDRDIYKIYAGVSKNYKSHTSYNFFTKAAFGYASLEWKDDPIDSVNTKDTKVTSSFLKLEAGLEFSKNINISIEYELGNYKTDLSTETKSGVVEEKNKVSLFVGGKFF